MRACINCKYRKKRINVSKCYISEESQAFINRGSNLVHNTVTVIVMVLIMIVGLLGVLSMLSMANHDVWWSCVAHGVGGAVTVGGSLMVLAYLTEKEERRATDKKSTQPSANR